jgi:hypothetical protein
MDLADPLIVVRDKKYDLEELLVSRSRCQSEIEFVTRRSFSAPGTYEHSCAYLKGAQAALVLLNRKIGLAMSQAKDQEKFLQAANKMVITTTSWYESQQQKPPQNQHDKII